MLEASKDNAKTRNALFIFYVEAAKHSAAPVLEVGCGTGRILIPTARAGIQIVGFDLSEHMLSVCRDPTVPRAAGGSVARTPGQGRHALLLTGSNLLIGDDTVSTLSASTHGGGPTRLSTSIHRHLVPGQTGLLHLSLPSLDLLVADNLGEEIGDEPAFTLPDGRRVVRRGRTVSRDRFKQITHVEMIYYVTHPDGSEERLLHAFPMRYLFRFEAEHLLARAGFAVEALYGDFDKSPYGATYPGELIFVATVADS
ncbi:MAG: class I SAM-dependent methyltransferase [Woeseiaceae bacterium]|nr:class I SAM-dependent methyltransferase [Woeseiaceae bacterium]